jgi:branched-chain amino acid transport system ATP-binding protein
MNPTETGALVRLIERIRTELATTVLLIEHHMRVVMTVSDVVTVLDQGRVLAEGAPREVQADPRVVAAYLGTQADDAPPEADAE